MSAHDPRPGADIAPAILWTTDPDGACTYLSRQWYDLTGQTPGEGLGQGWLEPVHPDDRAPSAEVFAEANERRAPFTLDYRLRRADGSYAWAIDAGQPRFSDSGDFLGYVGSVLDITERKHAEEALRGSERHFRALIEKGADLIAVLGPDGKARYVSPSFERVLGHRPGELHGRETLRLLHPQDLPDALTALRRLMEAPGRTVSLEMRVRHADASWRTLQANAVNRLEDPAVDGVVVNARDVTEQRRAEERLLRVTGTSPAVLYTLVPAGTATRASWVSSNIAGIMGHSVEDAISPGWWVENLHPDDRDAALQAMEGLFRTGSLSHEYRFRHGNGEYRWIRDQLRLIRGAEGNAVEIVGSWMDATEHRALQDQVHEAQKMEAIGRLAGGIAHDFNNVLTAVAGFAQMILEDLDESDPHWRDAEEIVRSSERGAALVRQLLAFSRRQVVQPEVVDPNAVVEGMESMLRRLIGGTVTLVTELDPAVGAVRADPGQLEQVLLNLVLNARDAMPESGCVTISTAPRELGPDRGDEDPDLAPGPWVALSVSDTGQGMDEEIQRKIFEPFFTTKEKEQGTGLGLSIVYGIVRQGGGHVRVSSEPGRGSTFEVYLPRVDVEPAAPQAPRSAAAPASSETVLLVEDESSVRRFARRVLERRGYHVLEAADGDEALRVFESEEAGIDVLVTDVTMPRMSGRVLAERLRERRPDLLVLFMSGYTEDEVVHDGLLGAGTLFLQKPFSPEDLVRKVRAVLDGARAGVG